MRMGRPAERHQSEQLALGIHPEAAEQRRDPSGDRHVLPGNKRLVLPLGQPVAEGDKFA